MAIQLKSTVANLLTTNPSGTVQLPWWISTPYRMVSILLAAVVISNLIALAITIRIMPTAPWLESHSIHIVMQALILAPVLLVSLQLLFQRYSQQHSQAMEKLFTSEKRFSDIAENANEWIWEVDAQGQYTYASPVVQKILGYSVQEVLGKHFYDFFHPDDREAIKTAAFAVFAAKQPFREFINRNVRKDGTTVWLSTSGIPVIGVNGDLLGYRGADTVKNDESSVADRLTGTLNREGFLLLGEHQLQMSLRNNLSVSLIFADMDNLKAINDEYGHLEGDHAIVDMANILQQVVRRSDTLARLSGDEFVILLSGSSGTQEATERVLHKIAAEVRLFNQHGTRPYRLSISAAAATYDTKHPESLLQLVNRADRAMYAVKREKHRES